MSKKKMLSFTQFIKRFPDENACVEYLYKVKWPEGFVCPVCGCRHCYAIKTRRQYQCTNCRHQTSLTANTVMHRSHLPLTKWFWAIYLVACDKRGISALALAGGVVLVIILVKKRKKAAPVDAAAAAAPEAAEAAEPTPEENA